MTNWTSLRRIFLEKQFYICQKKFPTCYRLNFSDEKNTSKVGTKEEELKYLKSHPFSSWEEINVPTTCCMSGCVNCVWIQYAEKVGQFLNDSDEDIQKVIMEKVQDPNMKAFLELELRCRNLIKK